VDVAALCCQLSIRVMSYWVRTENLIAKCCYLFSTWQTADGLRWLGLGGLKYCKNQTSVTENDNSKRAGNIDNSCYVAKWKNFGECGVNAMINPAGVLCRANERFVFCLVSYSAEWSVEHVVLHTINCRWCWQRQYRGPASATVGYGFAPVVTQIIAVHRESTAGGCLWHLSSLTLLKNTYKVVNDSDLDAIFRAWLISNLL